MTTTVPAPALSPASLRGTLGVQVVEQLGRQILAGDVAEGQQLPTEAELGEHFGISRTIVREAIKTLAAKGFVEVRTKTGTRVRPRSDWNLFDPDVLVWQSDMGVDEEFLRKLVDVRRLIEPGAARLAAQRITPAIAAALTHAYGDLQAASLADDPDAFESADSRFHTTLLQACGNELLLQLRRPIDMAVHVGFRTVAQVPGAFKVSVPLHLAVLTAVVEHRPDEAAAAMEYLLGESTEHVKASYAVARRPRKG
jgi:DNA-binding FadR family transcriptional regulator